MSIESIRGIGEEDGYINERGAQEIRVGEDRVIETLPVDTETVDAGGWELEEFIRERQNQDRDIRILITGRNSGVGLGKTQLAIQLCKKYDDDWSAEEKATLEASEAIHMLQNVDHGSAVLTDELGQIADARRGQSTESLELTHLWQMMRFKNLITVSTVPSMRLVDVRLLEMSDVRIHVIEQGLAKIYTYDIRDSDPKGNLQPQLKQRYKFDPIDGDPDYQYLNEMKRRQFQGEGGREYIPREEAEAIAEKRVDDLAEKLRIEWIQAVYNNTTLSQTDVGQLHAAVYGDSISQQAVSNLLRKDVDL